ncbi:hypothetical protein [Pseudomonas muyukensis]|uniref:Uncharacterized protein n=1 Tax=Pseudomonas muyukensis TaxID=2842357 RepID=A0ABX8M728_9PSED|nr:hypothetical protein [Pseudomonas muyukensis]QXH34337.1 hypothetical protein KSS95_19600 [Pseudomonas muyukensis]
MHSAELNEVLVAHNCLRSIDIQLNDEGVAYDLFLSVSVPEEIGGAVVRVRFFDVSQLAIEDFGGGLTQLMHMHVDKLDSGLDRVRYRFSDLEGERVSFYFSSFSVD